MLNPDVHRHVRHNFAVNLTDACFFGFGLGFSSSVTVVPLFVDTLTDSTTLIGLIASVQLVGWQLPQILTAERVAGLRRFLPMVLRMTLHERWPYLVLALVALLLPVLGAQVTLALTFLLLCWQAIGGGLTATAWQSMVAHIIPVNRRGTFWGTQSAGASLFKSVGSFGAGFLLVALPYPYNFAACFAATTILMAISWGFLAWTREPERTLATPVLPRRETRRLARMQMRTILRGDANVWVFMLARIGANLAWMAVAFYTIYGTREFGISEATAGALFGMLTLAQTVSSPFLGWLGDRVGHRRMFAMGALMLSASALVAILAQSANWLIGAFILAGLGYPAILTIAMTMTLEFGNEENRPYYIGLTNTLIAPATLVAPLVGGWLADVFGFAFTFALAGGAGLVTALLLLFVVRDPQPRSVISEIVPAVIEPPVTQAATD